MDRPLTLHERALLMAMRADQAPIGAVVGSKERTAQALRRLGLITLWPHRGWYLTNEGLAARAELVESGNAPLPPLPALSLIQSAMLRAIIRDPGRGTAAIAAAAQTDRSSTSLAIRALATAGLVTNDIDPQDFRCRVVRPTAAGIAACQDGP